MELTGNEKRIQALFLELKFAEACVAPEFGSLWNRAAATPAASSSVFKLSFALAMSFAVIALFSLVLWSRNWERIQTSTPDVGAVAYQPGALPVVPAVAPGSTQFAIAEQPQRMKVNRSVRRLVTRHRLDANAPSVVIPEAVAISGWRSPTAMLLQSPADDMLTSLPQLDLGVRDLKTFLPETLQ
ncbi:MAG: hypothetical protein ABI698_08910 [bacterium]